MGAQRVVLGFGVVLCSCVYGGRGVYKIQITGLEFVMHVGEMVVGKCE